MRKKYILHFLSWRKIAKVGELLKNVARRVILPSWMIAKKTPSSIETGDLFQVFVTSTCVSAVSGSEVDLKGGASFRSSFLRFQSFGYERPFSPSGNSISSFMEWKSDQKSIV
ncbi:hypothetical protein NPIL_80921 [Nephila pilipes]|uniref:Uncharacterized protein n=1 Tax=Nephila pilipes TaxID=299642 RepID=A0A8X6MB01_NEPPI|nr:hypothetical protein NPIL_80921 [Nephila pilipes]